MKFLSLFILVIATLPLFANSSTLQVLRFPHQHGVVEVPLPTYAVQMLREHGYLQQVRSYITKLVEADSPLWQQVQRLQLTRLQKSEHEELLRLYEQAEKLQFDHGWQQQFDRFATKKIFPWLDSSFFPLSKGGAAAIMTDYPRTWHKWRAEHYIELMQLKTNFYNAAEEIHRGIVEAMWENPQFTALFAADTHPTIDRRDIADLWTWSNFQQRLDQKVDKSLATKLLAGWNRMQIATQLQELKQKHPYAAQDMVFLAQLARATADPQAAGMQFALFRAAILELEESLTTEPQAVEISFSPAELWKKLYMLQRKTDKTLDWYVLDHVSD